MRSENKEPIKAWLVSIWLPLNALLDTPHEGCGQPTGKPLSRHCQPCFPFISSLPYEEANIFKRVASPLVPRPLWQPPPQKKNAMTQCAMLKALLAVSRPKELDAFGGMEEWMSSFLELEESQIEQGSPSRTDLPYFRTSRNLCRTQHQPNKHVCCERLKAHAHARLQASQGEPIALWVQSDRHLHSKGPRCTEPQISDLNTSSLEFVLCSNGMTPKRHWKV